MESCDQLLFEKALTGLLYEHLSLGEQEKALEYVQKVLKFAKERKKSSEEGIERQCMGKYFCDILFF